MPYCLKTPRGKLYEHTLAPSKHKCWGKSFETAAFSLGSSWRERYWKRWDQSLRSARKHGYRIVKVKIVEVKR